MTGIEPVSLAWKARVLPLHNTRVRAGIRPRPGPRNPRLTGGGAAGSKGAMIDIRPVANIIGRLTAVLGAMMAIPAAVDWAQGNPAWALFVEAGTVCAVLGLLVALATQGAARGLTLEQSFLLTSGLWLVLPAAGALPLTMGVNAVGITDAYFEAMSGMTTTGATIFPRLAELSPGTNLWRAMLNWTGGLGIVVVAMVFLPVMKIGGMQFFRSEGFDTMGKVLPRAGEIAADMAGVYLLITVACALGFHASGMTLYDSVVHALTACSTGGFSSRDASFGDFLGLPEVIATVFMVLASLPFVRMVQAVRGEIRPLWQDSQVHTFLALLGIVIGIIVLWRVLVMGATDPLYVLRETAFNVVTLMSGTGFSSTDVTQWGHLPFVLLILGGLIGACTGSTGCSIKVFRYQVLWKATVAQIRRMQQPHRVTTPRLEGRRLDPEVIDSVISFFTLFVLSFGLLIVALALTGLHPRTALTAAWTSIANIGPAWGPEVSGNGAVDRFPTSAKWLMILGMYLGRLELISVLVLFLPRFWRS